MNDKDIRWIQHFANYRKALSRLSQAVDILSGQVNGELDDLLKEGLIQRFEYTHELACGKPKAGCPLRPRLI